MSPTSEVRLQSPALWTMHGPPPAMTHPHRHDDIELNHVSSGALHYLFGGSRVTVAAGEVALFWGATPHQLLRPGTQDGEVGWVHVPLTTALGWHLGHEEIAALLRPAPTIVPADAVGQGLAARFRGWHDEMALGDPSLALLEVQALVRRVLRAAPSDAGAPRDTGSERMDAVAAMARHVAERFRDPITVTDVTGSVHLNPTYAMGLFRRAIGCSIGAYLVRCRVAEAQRLLISTSLSTAEVGHAAGFGSQSQFYAQFARTCGQAPGRYRTSVGRA